MKDAFGYELEIGNTVAFMEPGYAYALKVGKIIKMTTQKIVVEWSDKQHGFDRTTQTYKFPEQVAKNPNADTTTNTEGNSDAS